MAHVVVLCSAVSGCAVEGYTWEQAGRVEQMTIRLTEVADVGPICYKYLPGQTVMACSVMRADYCEIIVPPNSPGLVAHEAAHCLGFKHPGGQDITASVRNRLPPHDLETSASAAERPAVHLP